MEWANVSNTPYRLYKHWTHEGGIASPLIVQWPKGILAKGKLRVQPTHLIDIMATCIEIAHINYPKVYKGNTIQPMEGKSLLPAFTNHAIQRDFIFWEHEGNRAIRVGKWKLVSTTRINKFFTAQDENSWELYDIENDPSETKNIAVQNPEITKELSLKWEKEALRTKAKPWPWINNNQKKPVK